MALAPVQPIIISSSIIHRLIIIGIISVSISICRVLLGKEIILLQLIMALGLVQPRSEKGDTSRDTTNLL